MTFLAPLSAPATERDILLVLFEIILFRRNTKLFEHRLLDPFVDLLISHPRFRISLRVR